jgi:CHAT domain-containing protein
LTPAIDESPDNSEREPTPTPAQPIQAPTIAPQPPVISDNGADRGGDEIAPSLPDSPIVTPEATQVRLPDPAIANVLTQIGNSVNLSDFSASENHDRGPLPQDNSFTLKTVSSQEIGRLIDEGDLPQATLFLDIFFSEEIGGYLNREVTRELNSFSAVQQRISKIFGEIGTQPAIIYTFSREDRLDLILVPPSGFPIHKAIRSADRASIEKVVNQFRNKITDPKSLHLKRYLQDSQQLYDWIVRPLENDLNRLGIETLVFSMDEGLRSIPLAALHDGDRFLVEKYGVGLVPSINLTDTRYHDLKDASILAMGASYFEELIPLPGVPLEVANLQKIWSGKVFLNNEFTPKNLQQQRESGNFAIVHLATHVAFNPGQPEQSFIQFWDRKLAIERIRQFGWNDPPVNLLVLSACETALGDRQAELGFAGLAVQAGVKSALGSLWYVSDRGTLALMTEFYAQLRRNPIKVDALRAAQVAAIRGELRIENNHLIADRGNFEVDLPPELQHSTDPDLSHPYYWSAFTLVGSPW